MPPSQHLKALGHALVARRAALDPTHHRTRGGWMKTVTAQSTLSKRVIVDIETGARNNYATETLTTLERLYHLKHGTLATALTGGPLVADDDTVLYPTPAEDTPSPPGVRRTTHQGRILEIVADLEAEVDDLPDDVAEEMIRRSVEHMAAQALLLMDVERRRWERGRYDVPPPDDSET